VGHLILPAGTLSVGYFWADRPYNAYHWVTPAGNSLGLYLNISDSTVIKDHQVIWRDLVVDILITPDGRYRVLDEDELPQDIDPVLSAKIKRIRDELLASYETILREIEQCSLNFLSKKIGYL
jgi:predicted RNA-binding protein associated with RNAse of E/G family